LASQPARVKDEFESLTFRKEVIPMGERRAFLKMVAAGPAGALLLPMLSETGRGTLAAELEGSAESLGKLPENIIFSKAVPGVWKGKEGGHLPQVSCKKAEGKLVIDVATQHPMSEKHYIVRHTVVSQGGKVLGAKTFNWSDEPKSSYVIDLSDECVGKPVFVTSYCNLHDLWLAEVKLEG